MNKASQPEQLDLHTFSSHAYDESSYLADHRLLYKKLIRLIEQSGAHSILDVGAGTGLLYSLFPQKEKFDYNAVDILPDFVSLMQKRGIKALTCNIEQQPLPYADNKFDLVIFTGLLEHTLKPIYIINEMSRVLKKGGILILSTPNALSLSRRWNFLRGRNQFWPLIDNLTNGSGYLRRCSIFYSETEIRHLLKKLFSIEKVDYVNEDFFRNRKTSIIMKLIKLVATRIPPFQEIIVFTAKKI